MTDPVSYLTAKEVAELLRVSVDSILAYIDNGELRALNVAPKTSKRPRWRIKQEWIESWEETRVTVPKPKTPTRAKRRPKDGTVIEFYK